MRRFYVDKKIDGGSVTIEGAEAGHITRVLRMAGGNALILFDGSGYDYTATIAAIRDGGVDARIVGRELSKVEPGVKVDICQAVIKHDHFSYAVQKCTELGAFSFTPFLSERCVKRPKPGGNFVERAGRVALEAAKQCGRSIVPGVDDIMEFGGLAEHIRGKFALLCYEGGAQPLKDVLRKETPEEIALIIGPEGGFTAEEVEAVTGAGARAVSLGKLILRAESAGPAALAMITYEYGGRP